VISAGSAPGLYSTVANAKGEIRYSTLIAVGGIAPGGTGEGGAGSFDGIGSAGEGGSIGGFGIMNSAPLAKAAGNAG
jgi:hypothetical protein